MDDIAAPPADAASLKAWELRLAEQKLRDERELKERELALTERQLQQDRELKEREIQTKGRELAPGRWSGPFAVAVVGGLLAITGGLVTAAYNSQIERKKQEGTLLLEAIRTGGSVRDREQQVAANLVFLIDAGLASSISKEQADKLRQKAGDATPALPPAGGGGVIPEPVRQRILKSFDDFAAYFLSIGAKQAPKVRVEATPRGSSMMAYFDPTTAGVYIDPQYLGETGVPLREYAHGVLYAENRAAFSANMQWVISGIESGLASYFSSSLRNEARVPGSDQSLDNDKSLKDLKPENPADATIDGLYVWGGALWDLRKTIGQPECDKLLIAAWQNLRGADFKSSDPKFFVTQLVKADAALGGRHKSDIETVFRRRGLAL